MTMMTTMAWHLSSFYKLALFTFPLHLTILSLLFFLLIMYVNALHSSIRTTIDHFHKWQCICYSLVLVLVRRTGPTLAQIFF